MFVKSSGAKKKSRPTSGIRLSEEQVAALNTLAARTHLKPGVLKKIAIDWFLAYAEKNNGIFIPLEGTIPDELKPLSREKAFEAEKAGASAASREK